MANKAMNEMIKVYELLDFEGMKLVLKNLTIEKLPYFLLRRASHIVKNEDLDASIRAIDAIAKARIVITNLGPLLFREECYTGN